MLRSVLPVFLVVICLAGCNPEEKTLLVPDSPFTTPAAVPSTITKVSYTQAQTNVAARVDQLGRRIIAANQKIGFRPLFMTIGDPRVEVFHRGLAEVVVTEGLVQKCGTDGQLAAVLCQELGKMVSEREMLASPKTRAPDRPPPVDLRIGNDTSGGRSPDQTGLAELAQYDSNRRRQKTPFLAPDPQVLARTYLTQAGFQATELDAVAPLLRTAVGNSTLEKQLNTPGPARPWTH